MPAIGHSACAGRPVYRALRRNPGPACTFVRKVNISGGLRAGPHWGRRPYSKGGSVERQSGGNDEGLMTNVEGNPNDEIRKNAVALEMDLGQRKLTAHTSV